jgi:sugar/nucleoside kinase (ribokinase family)
MNYDVVCIGENCMDIIVKMDDRLATGRNHLCSELSIMPEGTGVNFAIASARLEMRTELLTTISIDKFGEDIRAVLGREGVYMHRDILSTKPTATIFAIIDGEGEKMTMSFIHGAAYEDFSSGAVDYAKALYVSGGLFTAEGCTRSAIDAMKNAGRMNIKVFFDPQVRIGEHIEGFRDWIEVGIERSDILFITDWELKILRGENTEKTIRELLKRLEVVCVKTGKKGCIVCSRDYIKKIPPFKVEAVSTLGCGDVFNAAFVKAFLDGMSMEDAGHFANCAAALNSKALGAVNGAPHLNDINSSLLR